MKNLLISTLSILSLSLSSMALAHEQPLSKDKQVAQSAPHGKVRPHSSLAHKPAAPVAKIATNEKKKSSFPHHKTKTGKTIKSKKEARHKHHRRNKSMA